MDSNQLQAVAFAVLLDGVQLGIHACVGVCLFFGAASNVGDGVLHGCASLCVGVCVLPQLYAMPVCVSTHSPLGKAPTRLFQWKAWMQLPSCVQACAFRLDWRGGATGATDTPGTVEAWQNLAPSRRRCEP